MGVFLVIFIVTVAFGTYLAFGVIILTIAGMTRPSTLTTPTTPTFLRR